ncbi:YktB family protein [Paenibacillus sp. GYB003]|uniref:YktB family protein n=1 Tax=Paenibacillus sp. GYB003 TaxID=2994392 RepID=UPI002F967686
MTFPTFDSSDFDVFTIPGLEPRMKALIERVRPKLTRLGDELAPALTAMCGEPMFPHVAKHARRTINPPADTWVAWANSKKGYKAHPHFQVGLWSTHLFVQFAVIYESGNKDVFARNLEKKLAAIRKAIPADFRWSTDHMQPETTRHGDMSKADFAAMIVRLKTVKKTEALCGITIRKDDPLLADPARFADAVRETFEQVMPLYRIAF